MKAPNILSGKAAARAMQNRRALHARINAAEALSFAPVHTGAWKHEEIVRLNADLVSEGTYREALTTYAVGWRGADYSADLAFLAPGLQTARRFDYKVWDNAEAFYSELTDDLRAPGADFKSVEYTLEEVIGKTHNHGLMVAVDRDQVSDMPNWEQHYTAMLLRRLGLNRLRRALNLLSAAATDNAATWDTSAGKDPDMDVMADIETGTDASGVRPNRVAYGPSAWTKRALSHRAQDTAGGFASAGMTIDQVATFLGLEKGLVCNARYATSASAKAAALANLVLLFNAQDGETVEDPSNIKRFWSPCDNGMEVMVHRWDVGAKKMCIAVECYELMKITSTLGIRKKTIS